VPDKPLWYGRLDLIIEALEALPCPWVDRPTVEQIFGVARRRAQQILAPCITQHIGGTGIADRTQFIEYLRRTASGDAASYERQRRRRLARTINQLRTSWLQQPRVPVEAPISVINQQLSNLPPGVEVSPGQVLVRFETAEEALQKLLALALAIGNDYASFERLSGG
jgi:hypothetical protein